MERIYVPRIIHSVNQTQFGAMTAVNDAIHNQTQVYLAEANARLDKTQHQINERRCVRYLCCSFYHA